MDEKSSQLLKDTSVSVMAERIEWHFTPKHASWLNQAEIEIHSLEVQGLSRRIPDFHTMQSEVLPVSKREIRITVKLTGNLPEKKQKRSLSCHSSLTI